MTEEDQGGCRTRRGSRQEADCRCLCRRRFGASRTHARRTENPHHRGLVGKAYGGVDAVKLMGAWGARGTVDDAAGQTHGGLV